MPSDFMSKIVTQALASYNARFAPAEELVERATSNGSVAPEPVPYNPDFRYSEDSVAAPLGGSMNVAANPLAGTRLWDWMSD